MRRLAVLALLAAGCPTPAIYKEVRPGLSCERATRVTYRTLVALGYKVTEVVPATPERAGVVSGPKPGPEGSPLTGRVVIPCDADGGGQRERAARGPRARARARPGRGRRPRADPAAPRGPRRRPHHRDRLPRLPARRLPRSPRLDRGRRDRRVRRLRHPRRVSGRRRTSPAHARLHLAQPRLQLVAAGAGGAAAGRAQQLARLRLLPVLGEQRHLRDARLVPG